MIAVADEVLAAALVVAASLGVVLATIALATVATFAVTFARPPRPRRLLRAVLHECLATLLLIPVWPLFAFLGARYEALLEGEPPDADGAAGRRRRPVILLHGYMMNRTNWLWLGPSLARRGLGPLYGLSWYSPGGTEKGARKLARFVESVCQREGAEQVDIVAHSMGGLVARHYIEQLGGHPRVRRLVTIATPHHGTAWARVAVGMARTDLGPPRAPGVKLAEGVLYTSIWSRCDELVVPPESAQLTPRPPESGTATHVEPDGDRLDDVVFDDLGHLGLLVSPRVAAVVATRLAA